MRRLFISSVSAICLLLLVSASVRADTTAYFPNEGDDNIKRVFETDEANFTEVDACQGPYGAAVTPDGEHLVVTCADDNVASIISTDNFFDTGTQLDVNLGTGHTPRGVAIESQGIYAYVANYGNNTVDEIIISSGSVVDTFDVGAGPWGVAATYDSVAATTKIYVSNHDADSVSVITNSGIQTISSVGDGPLGLALTPDGNHLYVANLNDDQVVVIDTSDLSIDHTINVGNGPWGVAMADDGVFVFVTNSLADSVTVISTGSQTVSGTYSVGDQPMGVAAPINGRFAYVVNQMDNSVSKVTTGGAVSTIGSGEFNGAFSLGAFIGGNPPDAPTALVTIEESSTSNKLTWTDNASDELGFKIERREETQASFTQIRKVNENITTYTDNDVDNNLVYHYRLRAYNEAADSTYTTANTEEFSWCFINVLHRSAYLH